MNIEIRPSQNGDAEGICRVIAVTWLDTYPNQEHGITKEMIYPRFFDEAGEFRHDKIAQTTRNIATKSPAYESFVAYSGKAILGVSSAKVNEAGKRKLNVIYVLPMFQGASIGSRLFDAVIDWHGHNDVYLKVATYNQRAIDFYVKRGFEEVGPVATEDEMRFDNGTLLPEIEMVKRV